MAKKLKPEEASTEGSGITTKELKRVVSDVLRHKEHASENAGLAGQAVKQAVERYALDRKAFTIVVGLAKGEVTKAQGTIRSLIEYSDKLGLLDQVDAFDDLIPMLKRILERAENQVRAENAGRERADDGAADAGAEDGIGAVH